MAMIFSYTDGFMIGWPLGITIGGGEPNWAMAGIGVGLIVVFIPISRSFIKTAKQFTSWLRLAPNNKISCNYLEYVSKRSSI